MLVLLHFNTKQLAHPVFTPNVREYYEAHIIITYPQIEISERPILLTNTDAGVEILTVGAKLKKKKNAECTDDTTAICTAAVAQILAEKDEAIFYHPIAELLDWFYFILFIARCTTLKTWHPLSGKSLCTHSESDSWPVRANCLAGAV